MISKEEVLRLAELCKLSLNDDEIEKTSKELENILSFLNHIKEVDTEGVAPTYQVNEYKEPLIEDLVKESLPQKEVLKNTVEEKYGYFKVLKIVD